MKHYSDTVKRLAEAIMPPPKKPCGGCTMCCHIIPVRRELGLESWTRCPHERGFPSAQPGCAVYERRPASCRVWSCQYALIGWDDELRPDRCGVVVDPHADLIRLRVTEGGEPLELPAAQFWAVKGYEDAWQRQPVLAAVLAALHSVGAVVWRYQHPEMGNVGMGAAARCGHRQDRPYGSLCRERRFWHARGRAAVARGANDECSREGEAMTAAAGQPRRTQPHPIDVRVGARLRQRRLFLGMNQQALGHLLGLTFQQVQKYENGANRINAGRLHYIARLLEVPVEWFFQPMEEGEPVDREELDLLGLYHQLPAETAVAFLALLQRAATGAAT